MVPWIPAATSNLHAQPMVGKIQSSVKKGPQQKFLDKTLKVRVTFLLVSSKKGYFQAFLAMSVF